MKKIIVTEPESKPATTADPVLQLANSCRSCKWWDSPDGNTGTCHGGPPTAIPAQIRHNITGQVTSTVVGAFPQTDANIWCKAHETRLPY